jgi:predicted nucleic acid-binding protein
MAGSPEILADTGALLAVIDRDDRWHGVCSEAFRQLRLPLLTSTAVLAELFHLFGETSSEIETAWKFIRSGAIEIAGISGDDIPRLHELMARYADHPMDFADATLVRLAEREAISTIFTVDYSDFTVYRIGGKGRFRIFPVDRPRR